MPLKCFVPGCNSGLSKDIAIYKQQEKKTPSIFHPPENMIATWNIKIPRADRELTRNDGVCELHFVSEDIIRNKIFEDAQGNKIVYELKKANLSPNAIPCIFPNLPIYFTKIVKKRKPPAERAINPTYLKKNKSNAISFLQTPNDNNTAIKIGYNIHMDAANIKLPGPMWGLHTDNLEKTLFTYIEELSNEKCIKFITPNTAKVFIREKETRIEIFVEGRDEVENLLRQINSMKICPGFIIKNIRQWSSKCMLYIDNNNVRCTCCKNLCKYLNRKRSQQKNTLRTRFKCNRAQQTQSLSKKV